MRESKLDLTNHPCFNPDVYRKAARIHLPVAPKCNLQCNYCDRSFDCANETRPGVSSVLLSPFQAVTYLKAVYAKMPHLTVVGIAGPGDPFANPVETMETLRLVRQEFPNILLCVATNGLGLVEHIDELVELKVSHVTMTINTVNPAVGAAPRRVLTGSGLEVVEMEGLIEEGLSAVYGGTPIPASLRRKFNGCGVECGGGGGGCG